MGVNPNSHSPLPCVVFCVCFFRHPTSVHVQHFGKWKYSRRRWGVYSGLSGIKGRWLEVFWVCNSGMRKNAPFAHEGNEPFVPPIVVSVTFFPREPREPLRRKGSVCARAGLRIMIDLYACLSFFPCLVRPSLQYSSRSSCLNSLTVRQEQSIPIRLSIHPSKTTIPSTAYCTKAPSLHPLLFTPNSTAAAPQSSP
jgi:hypothetical protein